MVLDWNSDEMRSVLLNARSQEPLLAKLHTMAISGSRTSQMQKAKRRPVLEYRSNSHASKSKRDRSPTNLAKSYIDGSTVRRLTSAMWCVRKQAFSGAKQDGGRLLKQIEKQLRFSAQSRTNALSSTISSPEIYGIKVSSDDDGSSIIVDMEYIPFNDVRHIMLERDKLTNEWLIDAAIELVDGNLTLSTMVPLSECLPEFQKKADSIKKALLKSTLATFEETKTFHTQVDRIMEHFGKLGTSNVPVGSCHGDLTFANMLVDTENREFCVFDFLDCFVVRIMNLA